jgi:stearoyl-CoA desaturase (delta-9 desaturase)
LSLVGPQAVRAKTNCMKQVKVETFERIDFRFKDWNVSGWVSAPFFAIHLFVLVSIFFWSWTYAIGLSIFGFYFVGMFAVTAGYHRYFSHRTFKTTRFFQFVLAFFAQATGQKGVLWWASHHRHHHKHSDQVSDVHSPVRKGFWWSHLGWIISDDFRATNFDAVRDLVKYPELVWLNRFYFVPSVIVGIVCFAVGTWSGLFVMFCSYVLLWHGTFTINSLCHVFGWQRYSTSDTSKNNIWLALLTLGEGWHNNHHTFMQSTRQGFFKGEIDITYEILKLLRVLGLVWDLKEPPLELLKQQEI